MPHQKINIFQNIASSFHICSTYLLNDYSNISMTDLELREKLYKNYDYVRCFQKIIKNMSGNEIFQIYDSFCLYYFIIKIPEEFMEKAYLPYLIIGPVLNNESSRSFIKSVIKGNSLPSELYEDFKEYYNKINFISDITTLAEWIISLTESFFERKFRLKEINIDNRFAENASLVYNKTPYIAASSIEERYDMEEKFLIKISKGDFSKAYSMYNNFKAYKIEQRSSNSHKNAQFMAIVLNTLCRKTLQYRNNVHPYYLDAISSEMAFAVAGTSSVHEVDEVSREFIRKYCLLAKNHSLYQYTEIVTKTISYIEFNYTDELSLSTIAEHFHVSKNYLSAIFKKQMGTTITDFIHSTRMHKAILLLNSTNLPVNNISQLCGYNDNNYFIRIFKRIYHQTPRQYRNTFMAKDL